jgi:hypothetical protein
MLFDSNRALPVLESFDREQDLWYSSSKVELREREWGVFDEPQWIQGLIELHGLIHGNDDIPSHSDSRASVQQRDTILICAFLEAS